jgi:hypothetical protein
MANRFAVVTGADSAYFCFAQGLISSSVRGLVLSSSRRCCETFGRAGQRRLPKCGNINPPHT